MLAQIEHAAAEARAELKTELVDTQTERDGLTDELERQSAVLTATERENQERAEQIGRHIGTIATLERTLAEVQEQLAREREIAEAARKASALAELRLEELPALRDAIEDLRGKLDAEREIRRKAEIEAAELRGQFGQRSPTLPLEMPATEPQTTQERLFDPGPSSRGASRRKKGT
jgi:chromosome segregation ATPase